MKVLLGLVLGAATLVAVPASATQTSPLVASCNGESGPEFFPCAWDGRHEGNGTGSSYVVDRRGNVIVVPHVYAHRLRGN